MRRHTNTQDKVDRIKSQLIRDLTKRNAVMYGMSEYTKNYVLENIRPKKETEDGR